MDIHLSDTSRRFIAEQVAAGLYPSDDAVLEEALSRMRREAQRADDARERLIDGAFRDDAELLEEIVEEAMRVREERPWRLKVGE